MCKKNRKKRSRNEAILQLGKEVEEVIRSKTVGNHVSQLRNCRKSATSTGREPYLREWRAIYVLSFGPHPGRRHGLTTASFLVASFIPRCHVIAWSPRDRFQPISGWDNRNFLGSLEFSIRRTCPHHRMRAPSTIWFDTIVSPDKFLKSQKNEMLRMI